jgi:hypothetical protein
VQGPDIAVLRCLCSISTWLGHGLINVAGQVRYRGTIQTSHVDGVGTVFDPSETLAVHCDAAFMPISAPIKGPI